MAKKDVNFIDQHIEKVVLGLCAAGFLAAVYIAFAGGRFKVNERGPGELVQAASDAAEQARQAVLSARYTAPRKESEADPKKDPMAQLAEWFGPQAKGLIGMGGLSREMPRAQGFGSPLVSVMQTAPEDRRELARIVAPGIPIVSSGRTTFRFLRRTPELADFVNNQTEDSTSGQVATRNWVSVGAQVDLIEQQASFLAQRYPEGSSLQIVGVHLQRRDVNDASGAWEDVDTFLPFKPPKRPTAKMSPDGRVQVDGLERFRQLAQEQRDSIVQTPLGQYYGGGDKVELPAVPYMDEPPELERPGLLGWQPNPGRFTKKWIDWANAALKGRKPFTEVDLHAALLSARAAVSLAGAPEKDVAAAKTILEHLPDKLPRELRVFARSTPRDPRRLMPILAHDLTAEPGHTYVYRMRYEVVNVFAGNTSDLKNPRDALRVTLMSEWSPESRPVEIKSDMYFYVTKADKAKKEITVAVYKVSRTTATKQEFKVSLGDEIGKKGRRPGQADFSTGTVCVDIEFDRAADGGAGKDVALIYANATDGTLFERSLSRDQKDPVQKRLAGMVKTPTRP
jgi:hypothetical protein